MQRTRTQQPGRFDNIARQGLLRPGAGTAGTQISVPNVAALAAYPASNLVKGAIAYVQSVGAYWSLLPTVTAPASNSVTVCKANIPATPGVGQWERFASGIQQLAQAVTAWYVSLADGTGPVPGNDENSGLDAAHPLATKAEIMRRWGTWSPTLNQGTTINYSGNDLVAPTAGAGTDPGLFAPNFVGGASGATLVHQPAAPLTPQITTTLATVNAKSVSGKTTLHVTLTAGAATAGMMIVNTSRGNSVAFLHRNLGGGGEPTWSVSQPFTPYAPPALPEFPTEVNTWAPTDNVQLFSNQPQVDLRLLGGDAVTAAGAGADANHVAYRLFLLDPINSGSDTMQVNANATVALAECFAKVSVFVQGGNLSAACISNCYLNGTVSVFQGVFTPFVNGGVISGAAHTGNGAIYQNDTIFDTALGQNLSFYQATGLGALFLDTGVRINANGGCNLTTLYGPGGLDVQSGQTFYTAPAVTNLSLSGAIQILNQGSAYSAATSGGVTTWHELAITAAALDAAAGAAGFGGMAQVGGIGLMASILTPP